MTEATPKAPAARRPLWAGPLLAGLCFGLAYGITHRLVALNVGELIRFGQGFDVQVFPGTSLDSLRLRFGATDAELRGNLELQQLERQQEEQPPPAAAAAPEGDAAPPSVPADRDAAAADGQSALEAPVSADQPPAPEARPSVPPSPPAPAPARP